MQKCNVGFTLIEIMITIMLSLIVFSELMSIYLGSQRSLQLQNVLYNMQENAKSAISILTTAVHQAGFIGCAKLTGDFPINAQVEKKLTIDNRLIGKDHELTVRYAEYPNALLMQSMYDNITLHADKHARFRPGDSLIISNCQRAELFIVKNIHLSQDSQTIIATQPLLDRYEKFSEVSRLAINRYFIAKTKFKHQDGRAVHALFMQDNHGLKSELVDDIENINMTYTINDSGILKEVAANEISNWSKVKAVAMKITLSLDTPTIKNIWHSYAILQ